MSSAQRVAQMRANTEISARPSLGVSQPSAVAAVTTDRYCPKLSDSGMPRLSNTSQRAVESTRDSASRPGFEERRVPARLSVFMGPFPRAVRTDDGERDAALLGML